MNGDAPGEVVFLNGNGDQDAALKTPQASNAPMFTELMNLVDFLGKNTEARKDIPIVLVPGFAGWGAPLLHSFNYFGGFTDLVGTITSKGWNVIIPSIAPLSTNHERACELFSQLTGAPNVDYGAAFTALKPRSVDRERFSKIKRKCSFKRPKAGPGLWIMPDDWTWGEGRQVHFICHSQGGNTVRCLIDLLRKGNLEDSYFTIPGRDTWARSVVTLATPHNGSTVIDILNSSGPNVERLLQNIICATSFMAPEQRVYDVQLDHWGIQRLGKEGFPSMLARMTAPEGPYTLWRNSHLNGFYDNSVAGVSEMNDIVREPSPLVYYFTMSFCATVKSDTFKITTADVQTLIPAIIPILKWIPLLKLYTYPISFILARLGNHIGTFSSLLNWGVTRINVRLPGDAIIPAVYLPGTQLPRWDILPIFAPTAYGMGGWNLTPQQKIILSGIDSEEWQENDGVVNRLSQSGPFGRENRLHEMTTPSYPEKGLFNHLGLTMGLDHADVLGINFDTNMVAQVEKLYGNLAELLSLL